MYWLLLVALERHPARFNSGQGLYSPPRCLFCVLSSLACRHLPDRPPSGAGFNSNLRITDTSYELAYYDETGERHDLEEALQSALRWSDRELTAIRTEVDLEPRITVLKLNSGQGRALQGLYLPSRSLFCVSSSLTPSPPSPAVGFPWQF